MPQRGVGIGIGCIPSPLDRLVHLRLDDIAERLLAVSVEDMVRVQVPAELNQRVVVARLLDLLAAAVRLVVVVGRVGEEAVGLALDQGRPLTGTARSCARFMAAKQARTSFPSTTTPGNP